MKVAKFVPTILLACFGVQCCTTSEIARAGDLLVSKLSEDGSWAEYEVKITTLADGKEVNQVKGRLRVSSVGQAEVNGKKCRWIEFNSQSDQTVNNVANATTILKILITEEFFKGDEELKRHVHPNMDEAARVE